MYVCQEMRRSSRWIWNNLYKARKQNFQLGEESITDLFLLNLKHNLRRKLAINVFTKRQEALNGADWEWWIQGTSGNWLGMRIQAKILHLEENIYRYLDHKNKYGKQGDLLVNDASKYGLIPLYFLYTHWDKLQTNKQGHYLRVLTSYHCHTAQDYGCSILNPAAVKRKLNLCKSFTGRKQGECLRQNKSLEAWISDLLPMPYIFCHDPSVTGDLPSRVLSRLHSWNPDLNSMGLQSSAPPYVRQIIEGDLDDDSLSMEDSRLKGVMILQEQERD